MGLAGHLNQRRILEVQWLHQRKLSKCSVMSFTATMVRLITNYSDCYDGFAIMNRNVFNQVAFSRTASTEFSSMLDRSGIRMYKASHSRLKLGTQSSPTSVYQSSTVHRCFDWHAFLSTISNILNSPSIRHLLGTSINCATSGYSSNATVKPTIGLKPPLASLPRKSILRSENGSYRSSDSSLPLGE